jgi:hypothetical protein
VFTTAVGLPVSDRYLARRDWADICKAAGIGKSEVFRFLIRRELRILKETSLGPEAPNSLGSVGPAPRAWRALLNTTGMGSSQISAAISDGRGETMERQKTYQAVAVKAADARL